MYESEGTPASEYLGLLVSSSMGRGVACGRLSAMRYSGIMVKMMHFDLRAAFFSFPPRAV